MAAELSDNQLLDALEGGALELLFQPEVDLRTGALVAMQGVLRWRHPLLGLLTPPALLDLPADGTAPGEWVLRAGAAEVARWGRGQRLWVSVSAAELVADGFAQLVRDVVREHDLAPGALGLQVLESCVIALGPGARPLLEDLRAAGVALAVDDFSSFYSTLGAIGYLPVDAVTLSGRYVHGVGETVGPDGDGDPLVRAVIEQAHAHGIEVVADGVETWGEAARLTELGCDLARGWPAAGPHCADRARWLLAHGRGWQNAALPDPRCEA